MGDSRFASVPRGTFAFGTMVAVRVSPLATRCFPRSFHGVSLLRRLAFKPRSPIHRPGLPIPAGAAE